MDSGSKILMSQGISSLITVGRKISFGKQENIMSVFFSLVPGFRTQVPGVRHQDPGHQVLRYEVSGLRFPGPRYQVSG